MDPGPPPPAIRIAAAVIDDGAGRLLLVRKAGTERFMQAGGKIEPGEAPLAALGRELAEELGLGPLDGNPRYLGRFEAPAANEAGHLVIAEMFHLRLVGEVAAAGEIAEAMWVAIDEAEALPLAPLTRDHVLPLARSLNNPP